MTVSLRLKCSRTEDAHGDPIVLDDVSDTVPVCGDGPEAEEAQSGVAAVARRHDRRAEERVARVREDRREHAPHAGGDGVVRLGLHRCFVLALEEAVKRIEVTNDFVRTRSKSRASEKLTGLGPSPSRILASEKHAARRLSSTWLASFWLAALRRRSTESLDLHLQSMQRRRAFVNSTLSGWTVRIASVRPCKKDFVIAGSYVDSVRPVSNLESEIRCSAHGAF